MEKSRWQQEYEALPGWARNLVDGMRQFKGYGFCAGCPGMPMKAERVTFVASDDDKALFAGLSGALTLAQALSAPWPPPAPPPRERRAINLVEVAADADGDTSAFDQPCAFGHAVHGHAVYCHNTAWPDSPRKCRRGPHCARLFGIPEEENRHEDCPGFVANPDWRGPE